MRIFFDSSSLAKRYIEEPGSERIEKICSQATEIGVSLICLPEIISALSRLRRNSILTKGQYLVTKDALMRDFEDISVCNITSEVIGQTIHIIEINPIRTLDALHIGCALEWKAEVFVSSDLRQLSAAKKMGLKSEKV